MEIAEYQNIYENEDSHFFYVAVHELVLDQIERVAKNKKVKILDAGCGTGGLLKKMRWSAQGIDFSAEAVRLARKRGLKAIKGSIGDLPYKDESFDIVTCIDVLITKEVGSDTKALKELCRVLKPGGILIMRVSAVKWLKLAHDKHVHSVRRYNAGEIVAKLKRAGFGVKRISYLHLPLLLVNILQHFREKWWPPKKVNSSISQPPEIVNSLALAYLRFENWLVSLGVNLPFGLGLLAIAKKPSEKN